MRGVWRLMALVACVMAAAWTRADDVVPVADDTTAVVRVSHREGRQRVASPHGTRVVSLEGDTLWLSLTPDSIAATGLYTIVGDSAAATAPFKVFNPDPKRAMWLSVLCPGLGQAYNRRYWKLPIVVGAFVGLSYGTSWNNRMLQDYRRAYRDATDSDPSTNSYMNFFAPTVKESDLDPEWIKRAMKNKRDYYRRYRDICIIGLVGVYLINVVDAYVDASLAHFDISPDLSLDVRPAAIDNSSGTVAMGKLPAVGLQCAITF